MLNEIKKKKFLRTREKVLNITRVLSKYRIDNTIISS